MLYRRRRKIRVSGRLVAIFLFFTVFIVVFEGLLTKVSDDSFIYDGARKHFENSVASAIEELTVDVEFVNYRYNEDSGAISAVIMDTEALNSFKTGLESRLNRDLCGTSTLWIPLGNFLPFSITTGIGPPVPVNINFTGTAQVDYKDEITSSGINQTSFSLKVNISGILHCHSSKYNSEISLNTQYVLVQNVIMGEIPRVSYGNGIP